MRKRLKIAVGLIFIAMFVWETYYFGNKTFRTATQQIDLSGFKGRVIPADNLNVGVLTNSVSLAEAKKWGGTSLLFYGREGLMFCAPDNITAGAFLYFKEVSSHIRLFAYQESFNGMTLIIRGYTPFWGKIFFIFSWLVVTVIVFIAGFLVVISIREDQPSLNY